MGCPGSILAAGKRLSEGISNLLEPKRRLAGRFDAGVGNQREVRALDLIHSLSANNSPPACKLAMARIRICQPGSRRTFSLSNCPQRDGLLNIAHTRDKGENDGAGGQK